MKQLCLRNVEESLQTIIILPTKATMSDFVYFLEENNISYTAFRNGSGIKKEQIKYRFKDSMVVLIMSSYLDAQNDSLYKINKDDGLIYNQEFYEALFTAKSKGAYLMMDEADQVLNSLLTYKIRPFRIQYNSGTFDNQFYELRVIDGKLKVYIKNKDYKKEEEESEEFIEADEDYIKVSILNKDFLSYTTESLPFNMIYENEISIDFTNSTEFDYGKMVSHITQFFHATNRLDKDIINPNGFWGIEENICYFENLAMKILITSKDWIGVYLASATIGKEDFDFLEDFKIIKSDNKFDTSFFKLKLYNQTNFYDFISSTVNSIEPCVLIKGTRAILDKMNDENIISNLSLFLKYKETPTFDIVYDDVLHSDFHHLYMNVQHSSARGSNQLRNHKHFIFDISKYRPPLVVFLNFNFIKKSVERERVDKSIFIKPFIQVLGRMTRGRKDKTIHITQNEHNKEIIDYIINDMGVTDIDKEWVKRKTSKVNNTKLQVLLENKDKLKDILTNKDVKDIRIFLEDNSKRTKSIKNILSRKLVKLFFKDYKVK